MVQQVITKSLIPQGLIDILARDYPDYKIDSVDTIEKNGQTTYRGELEKSWDEQLLITITKEGKVLNISK